MTPRRPVRTHGTVPTEEEWDWLTAAPGHNAFMGFADRLGRWERLQAGWDAREVEIRRGWGDTPPELPYGHPALHGGRVGCPRVWMRRDR